MKAEQLSGGNPEQFEELLTQFTRRAFIENAGNEENAIVAAQQFAEFFIVEEDRDEIKDLAP